MTRFILLSVIAFNALSLRAEDSALSPDAALLERTGQRVKQFWDELSSVACTEQLTQEKLNEKGKVVLKNRATYDYLISLRWNGGDLMVDESRLEPESGRKKVPESALLSTGGFATLLLVLHPDFQPGYSFTVHPEETDAGRAFVRIGFVPRNESRSPGVLMLKGREYPISWEGTAWIETSTARVVRVQARWKEPPPEIGLETLSSDVRYLPVTLRGDQTYWLPETARIEVKTRHQHWRNSHQFSGYRLFSVEVEDNVAGARK
jgi:hypothetical protein